MDTSTVPLAKKSFSQTTIDAAGDIYGTGKENIVNNSCQSTEALKDSFPNPPDNDDADIFGLNAHDKNSKKRILSDTETVPIQSQEKRARHSSGDDIFGFGEPSNSKVSKTFENLSKKSDNSLKALDRDDEDLFGFEEPSKKAKKMFNPISQENNKGSSSSVSVSTARTISTSAEDENQNMTAGLKVSNITKFESTGFLGKEDITIKSEVKTEYVEDTSGDVSALSASMVKVTLLNLLRPSTPKPSYVPSLNPDPLGKPVVNYKKFQKQSVDKTRAVISLVIYVPSDLSQSGIDEWFNRH
eukprot:GFUD01029275.1.p1 GENE.GFUD01029275.1~~GFUD01029275.1.p1  ORF type:complete len:300 (-),score=78.27 GFUD01029275.1:191-1090(-)